MLIKLQKSPLDDLLYSDKEKIIIISRRRYLEIIFSGVKLF